LWDALADQSIEVAERIAERTTDRADDARGAVRTVETCIEGLRNSVWPEVAWRFSLLSTDGCPLQFAFSTTDDVLRYTVEVAGPERPEASRLGAACELIDRLGGASVPAERRRSWEALQSRHPLRWGAWVGIRHDGASFRLKLYIEVPRAMREAGQRWASSVIPGSLPMMIGYDSQAQSEEHYFRQPQMDDHKIATFLRFVGDAAHRRATLDAFTELCGMPARAALQWMNFGYSVPRSPERGREFVMFVRSSSLRDVAKIRSLFLKRERRPDKTRSFYRDRFEDLPRERLPDHEIVSVIGRETDDAVELRVGVSAIALARL
jgi:hypothetical protein